MYWFPLKNTAVSIKLLEFSVTSLSGFSSYDGGSWTKKYKVVAFRKKREVVGGAGNQREKTG